MIQKIKIPCIILLLGLLWSCQRELPPSLESYHLVYDISYMEDMAGDVPTSILPRRMDAYYTKQYVYTEIEGFFRQFRLVQIADLRKRRVTSLLNFFGNKVYYTGEPGQLPAGIRPLEDLKLTHTDDTLRIGGLLSERVIAESKGENYSIYYTRHFSARRPNISTPYYEIHHPLTDFRIQLSMLKMHATCTLADNEPLETELLVIPENYKEVSREGMEEIINSLFTKE